MERNSDEKTAHVCTAVASPVVAQTGTLPVV